MKKREDLTHRKVMILTFIQNFIKENNYSPTVREISIAVGLKSSSTVHGHLSKLQKDGWIKFEKDKPRTIRVLEQV